MYKKLLSILVILFLISSLKAQALAVNDPLAKPNNKFGIHILFDSELNEAKKLVNSNGGDWGYVVIPLQSGDKDLLKWQAFMDKAKKEHLIPIIRLATEGDYFNHAVWRKPTDKDVLDFANFLNSLSWPTANRYIIIFNEVNRADEWGGTLNPTEYAKILSYSVTIFKSLSSDFFIVSSGLDNAAPNQGTLYMDEYRYIRQMDQAVPGIFNQVDGVASHSYPNPGFSQPPSVLTSMSISSFSFERDLLSRLSTKSLPIFITETGWSGIRVKDYQRSEYYKEAFQKVWDDPQIITVAPFVLHANGNFAQFSFLNQDSTQTSQYKAIYNMPKIKGQPVISSTVLSASSSVSSVPIRKEFVASSPTPNPIQTSKMLQATFKWIMKL